MKFRSLVLVLVIAFSAIFLGMIGTSYAYYAVSGGANLNVTTGNVNTNMAVIFAQSQYINISSGIPIDDSQVDTLASSSVFTITPNPDVLIDNRVAANISIVDIMIDEALKVSDFKYKLTCSDGNTSMDLSNGTGENFTDEVISNGSLNLGSLSTDDNTLDISKIYTCDFRVWISETNKNQNHLMNKKFRGLIKVNSLF